MYCMISGCPEQGLELATLSTQGNALNRYALENPYKGAECMN